MQTKLQPMNMPIGNIGGIVADTPQRESAVRTEVAKMTAIINDLEEATGTLCARLDEYLLPEMPSGVMSQACKTPPPQPTPPMAARLESLNQRLQGTVTRIHDILQRLEC